MLTYQPIPGFIQLDLCVKVNGAPRTIGESVALAIQRFMIDRITLECHVMRITVTVPRGMDLLELEKEASALQEEINALTAKASTIPPSGG